MSGNGVCPGIFINVTKFIFHCLRIQYLSEKNDINLLIILDELESDFLEQIAILKVRLERR